MLQIQRASAGSGKTYTLTKKFILHLISRKDGKGNLRLRTLTQVEDALPKILAITFTNKATNEMKTRIVEKLAALSLATNEDNLTDEFVKGTDYLNEFANLLHASFVEIGNVCKHALLSLLNNYSLFHISTIDAFFQEILRTFAYEVNMNDSYQLEIDSELISSTALDSTLNDFERDQADTEIAGYWLRILMKQEARKSQQWNVFSKSQSRKSIYTNIKKALWRLESEEYKIHKNDLDKFFSSPDSPLKVKEFYKDLYSRGQKERETALKIIQEYAHEIADQLESTVDTKEIFNNNFLKHLSYIEKLKIEDKFPYSVENLYSKGSVTKSKKNSAFTDEIDSKAMNLYRLILDWNNPKKFPNYTDWQVYGELLPYFGLILEVSKRLSEIMRESNIIRISDTNTLLRKIIGVEDTPFVYEKLGTIIDSYLIDEFQDTSRMQWDVLYPLILEAESQGHESLIIGDPKQSIYRFRNADHTLITKVVPDAFPEHIDSGLKVEENTNWRSKKLIVEFNNIFFRALVKLITEFSREKGEGEDYQSLYSNVVQYPAKQKDIGYVEIRFFSSSEDSDSSTDNDDSDSLTWFDKKVLTNIGPLISSLIDRGYRQQDIGILVSTNAQGTKIIEQLVNYNQTLSGNETHIDFISEDSLLLSSSKAVEKIISVIERIADSGRHKEFLSQAKNKIGSNVDIEKILNKNISDKDIQALMESMETLSLPSLIEKVVSDYLTDDLKSSEAIYISALQDAVNENSMQFSDDPASLLEWWNKKGKLISVSSPGDIDAIQIMTVHKSKGLEFKCVIIPYATDNFLPSYQKEEWKWVKPLLSSRYEDIPPLLPVKPSSSLISTPYEYVYREYVDQVMTDKLNNYYVAFTRAKNELYIFSKLNNGTSATIQDALYKICLNPNNYYENDYDWLLSPDKFQWDEDECILRAGSPLSSEIIRKEYSLEDNKKEKEANSETKQIKEYLVYDYHPKLKFKLGNATDFED